MRRQRANRKMQASAILEFTLQGQQMSLEAFVEDGTRQIKSLFVPVPDSTARKRTGPAVFDLKRQRPVST